MLLPDINILIYAFRPESADHDRYRDWLQEAVESSNAFGVSDLILSSAVRIVTSPQAYIRPTPIDDALAFADFLRSRPNSVPVNPGSRHWAIFSELCTELQAAGNLISDCYLAALAIEHGCEWVTKDNHFARFPGLRWRRPFE